MSDYDDPRPSAGTAYSDPCAVKDMATTLGKLMDESGYVTTYTGKSLPTITELASRYGWVIKGLFASGFTFETASDLGQDANGDLWRYTGTLPFTVTAGTVPSSPLYREVFLRDHNSLDNRNAVGAHDASAITYQSISLTERIQKSAIPTDFGGVVGELDSTATFDSIELSMNDQTIDLLGETWNVDYLPTGNNYINGEFVVDLNRFPVAQEGSATYSKSQFNLRRSYSDSRFTAEIPAALKNSTIILGDSISHGAYQGNLYEDGWVNIFKRMVNAENGFSTNGSYGFVPLLSWSGINSTVDIANITFAGSPPSVSSVSGESVLNGLAFELGTTQSVTSNLPTFQASIRVWYVQHPSGGSMDVKVNGVTVATIDTSGALNLAANTVVTMTDNTVGRCTVSVTANSGVVTFCGFGYETSTNVVNNFSQSGRKLIDQTELCLKTLCMGANLVMALGHNDVAVVEANSAGEKQKFTDNIDHIIKWSKYYNTNVIVPDFCWWTETKDSHVRRELQRLVKETSGTYVDFPSLLTRNYRNKLEFGSSFYLINTTQLYWDTSHPKQLGSQWIAETIASKVGLNCTTKKEALEFHDFWMPLSLIGTSLVNKFTTVPNLTAVRKNGNEYQYNVRLKKTVAGGAIPVGSYAINTTGALKVLTTANNIKTGIGTLKPDGGAFSKYYIDQQGLINIYIEADVGVIGTIDFGFSHIRY